MSKFVNQEIEPDKVWINISNGKTVRAAVLTSIFNIIGCANISMGVYKLEDEAIRTVETMVKCAKKGENIRFYVLERLEEDNNDVTG